MFASTCEGPNQEGPLDIYSRHVAEISPERSPGVYCKVVLRYSQFDRFKDKVLARILT